MPYINEKEFDALLGSIDCLKNLVEAGAEGESLEMLNNNMSGLWSIVDKVKSEWKTRRFKTAVKKEVERLKNQ